MDKYGKKIKRKPGDETEKTIKCKKIYLYDTCYAICIQTLPSNLADNLTDKFHESQI